MLALIALLSGALAGLAAGVWTVGNSVRRSTRRCIACGRPWTTYPPQGSSYSIRLIPPEAKPTEGDKE
jgi:hypothetical protein